jgi:SAM-dependent methyltransferase
VNNYEYCADFAAKHGGRVLDYGCGKGQIVELLLAHGVDAFGCDLYYEGGSYRDVVDQTLLDQQRIREMSNSRIPFDDGSFDVVVHNQVFEHVPDLNLAVCEIARVLKPGGAMLGMFPDDSPWREGHVGVPFLHWFPKGSRGLRVWYAFFLRSLGFGFHHRNKTRLQWARDACEWIDKWTYYRPYVELQRSFGKYFTPFQHIEADWLSRRFPSHAKVIPQAFSTAIVRRWAGMVVVCKRNAAHCGVN